MRKSITVAVFILYLSCNSICVADELDSSGEIGPRTTAQQGRFADRKTVAKIRDRFAGRKVTSNLKRRTWKVDTIDRDALLFSPLHHEAKRPVVFIFHGHGGNPEHVASRLQIHELWPDAICVYPSGLPTPVPFIDPEGKRSGWQKSIGDQDDRDLHLFDKILESLKLEYEIDSARVYATGHSNGGFFTYVLWAARGKELAAVAPIAASHNSKDFRAIEPKPVLHIAGEQDPIVKFSAQQRTIEIIKQVNGCDAVGRAVDKNCTEYKSPTGASLFTYIHPGGHEIPADAGKRIVEFFRNHSVTP